VKMGDELGGKREIKKKKDEQGRVNKPTAPWVQAWGGSGHRGGGAADVRMHDCPWQNWGGRWLQEKNGNVVLLR